LLRIGLDESDTRRCADPGNLPRAADEHLAAEVRGDDGHRARGPVVRQGEVAGAGAEVENGARGGGAGGNEPGGAGAPALVDIEAQEVIEEVVRGRDLAEHAADASFALVEQFSGHDASWRTRFRLRYYSNRVPAVTTTGVDGAA
jgi:hypothetical protein